MVTKLTRESDEWLHEWLCAVIIHNFYTCCWCRHTIYYQPNLFCCSLMMHWICLECSTNIHLSSIKGSFIMTLYLDIGPIWTSIVLFLKCLPLKFNFNIFYQISSKNDVCSFHDISPNCFNTRVFWSCWVSVYFIN